MASVTGLPLPMREAEQAPAGEGPRRAPARFRRRLRTRIILAFVLLGFGLTLLLAFATNWARSLVENQLVEDVMNRNLDEAWFRFARSGGRDPGAPVEQMKGYFYPPEKFDDVRRSKPDWYAYGDGIYDYSEINEDGSVSHYKLGVRKTPQAWFFLRYDVSQVKSGEERFNNALAGVVVAFTALSLLVGWWAASRVMSPVSELAERLRLSGRSSQPEALADHFPDDEVGQLASALDDYAARLTEVVQRDREFNADVSHELRTPLSVIRGAVELLLSRPDIDDKTRARLLRIQLVEQQCTDLISALLLLTRNERGHGNTDVARVAEQLFAAHRGQLGSKPLTLRLEGGPGQVVVDAPESAVTVALGNLVGNAVKYTQQGEVVVRLRDNAVDVIDSGPGLSAEDAARLFERGYRGTHAEHSQGGGIGLSIVRRLCDLYGWSVRVVPGEQQGVVATLTFSRDDA